MDDIPSGRDEAPVPGEAASRGGRAALSSDGPATALPSFPPDPDATMVPGSSARLKDLDATMVPVSSGRRSPILASGSFGASLILLQIGTVLGGRYEILELLGEGGMGAVYKAADREVDRIVALKVIRPEMASNPDNSGPFQAGAGALLPGDPPQRDPDLRPRRGPGPEVHHDGVPGGREPPSDPETTGETGNCRKRSTSWNRWPAGSLPLTAKESSTAT